MSNRAMVSVVVGIILVVVLLIASTTVYKQAKEWSDYVDNAGITECYPDKYVQMVFYDHKSYAVCAAPCGYDFRYDCAPGVSIKSVSWLKAP